MGKTLAAYRRKAALLLLPLAAFGGTACLGYAADGTVATPAAPGQTSPSRLPQLLSQLQGGSAGLELFDATPQSQVLAAQDAQGKSGDATAPAGGTVAGAKTPGITPIAQQPPGTNTPTPRPGTPTPTPGPGTPTAQPTATPTATATSSPSPTPTPTPTGTPTLGTEQPGRPGTPPTGP